MISSIFCKPFSRLALYVLFLAVGVQPCETLADDKQPRLIEGTNGIAAQYPLDAGIARDPRVVFVELFDDDLRSVRDRWESVQNADGLSLSEDVPHATNGDQGEPGQTRRNRALLVTHVGGSDTGSHLYRRLPPGYEKLHYRFYVKFAEDCAPIHHFFHVGGYHPMTAWPQGGAGQRPRGDERFTTGVEPFGTNWQWDYYSYWMEMRGSPPRGQCWGNSFLHDPVARVTRGQWQCLELMMKLNEVGTSNGEMALWLDGKLLSHLGPGFPRGKWIYDKFLPGQGGEGVTWSDEQQGPVALSFADDRGDPFEGFRWRSDEALKLNMLWLLVYITQSPAGHVSHIWFDNVVVATEYIGPVSKP